MHTLLQAVRTIGLVLSLSVTNATAAVFINELHYDNTGADVGEGVELAGSAGIDLLGWQLAFYNGSTGTSYASLALSGVLPDEGDGFGASFFGFEGMQNGPDGIALVDAGMQVIQFLSYEGEFTATDGPALGLTSFDIAVAESNAAPGESLQLTGRGRLAADFSWVGPLASSYGTLNAGQIVVPVPAAAILFPCALGVLGLMRGWS